METRIRQQMAQVQERMAAAARAVGRSPDDVRLVVVTKAHPLETVRAALAAGARLLGENYADKAAPKIEALADQAVEWHMIGHVQSRKAGLVARHFHMLHSLDRVKIAEHLDRLLEGAGRRMPVLLEINVSGETSKFGWPAWEKEHWWQVLAPASEIASLPNLEIRGLMTIAPWGTDAEQARPFFRTLREIRDFMQVALPQLDLCELSMGMSADFETAIEEGATLVRIGTAILGAR